MHMKNVLLILLISTPFFSFSQVAPMPVSRISEFFVLTKIAGIPCDSWGTDCFFEAKPIFDKKKDYPEWLTVKTAYAIKIDKGTKISRAYSDANSIFKNTGVSLKNPIIEFKEETEGQEYILIVYTKAVFPKKKK